MISSKNESFNRCYRLMKLIAMSCHHNFYYYCYYFYSMEFSLHYNDYHSSNMIVLLKMILIFLKRYIFNVNVIFLVIVFNGINFAAIMVMISSLSIFMAFQCRFSSFSSSDDAYIIFHHFATTNIILPF